MRFEAIDGCPVPSRLAPVITQIKSRSGAVLNSAYRGQDPGAQGILRRYGKMNQAQLHAGWVRRLPGFNPANQPGKSTHELRSDGVAYRFIPAGAPLRWWMLGLDWSNATGVVKAAAAMGFTCTVTYPGNPREGHHTNFRKAPRFVKPFPVLKVGDRGKRVSAVRSRLAFVRRVDDRTKAYFPEGAKGDLFTPELAAALRAFQRDHKQRPDGVYGRQTARQLNDSVNHQRKASR